METTNGNAVFGDVDYMPLEALTLNLEEKNLGESGTFTLCFWIYLLKSSTPGFIIRQGPAEGPAAVPFLALDIDRKLVLHPLQSVAGESDESMEDKLVVSDQVCPMEKWVHVGCEIGSPFTRLHMVGTVVGERLVSTPGGLEGIVRRRETFVLSGGHGHDAQLPLQGFVYYVRLLPQPSVTDHFVKNPPLELVLDGPSGASDDYELEEGGDGVWSVVGGKASCRRNFALDVTLLDALGRSVHKEMELVAFLVFADTGLPVEKPKDDAEAPLLTTFDGVEFPSSERPIKLVHGRASFKLKISQLSSKCDNRLFRVCFDSPSTPKFPFLRAFSRPIRCVSRNRNHRVPVAHWKQPGTFPLEGSISSAAEETTVADPSPSVKDSHCHDASAAPPVNDLCYQGLPQKRTRTRLQKEVPVLANGHNFLHCPSDNRPGMSPSEDAESSLSLGLQLQKPILPAATAVSRTNWLGSNLGICARVSRQLDPVGTLDFGTKQELLADGNTPLAITVANDSNLSQRWNSSFSDHLVFKYCLENMHGRGEFLKAFVMGRCDQEIADFATRVSQITGCRHDRYQVLIARNLLISGNEMWAKVSQESFPPLWTNVIKHVDQSFITTSGCVQRSLSAKDKEFFRNMFRDLVLDKEFLKNIAGCGEFVSREEFGRLWNWIYPVALALRSSQLCKTWDNEDPRWIEGMISQEEVEGMLKSGGATARPGSFLLRFAGSRLWPHPDSGALVVSYVGHDMRVIHKILALDESSGFNTCERPLLEQLLSQPELTQLCRVPSTNAAG